MQYLQWTNHDLFSFQFWFLLVILLVPWFIWWKLVDRRRLAEILLYGLFVSTVVTILDELGSQINLWEYKYDIEPFFPRMIPVNLTAIPVFFMFVYQYFGEWKSFLKAIVVIAAAFSFIGEPVFAWLDIYKPFNWKLIYSFPSYILIAVLLRWLTKAIMKKQHLAEKENSH